MATLIKMEMRLKKEFRQKKRIFTHSSAAEKAGGMSDLEKASEILDQTHDDHQINAGITTANSHSLASAGLFY